MVCIAHWRTATLEHSADPDSSPPTPEMDNDEPIDALIQRVRSGDERAAAILVQRYEVEICAEIRRRMRRDWARRVVDTADICQSVMASFFFRVALGQYDFHGEQDLVRLLIRMAQNKVVSQRRHQHRQSRDIARTQSLDAMGADSALDDEQPSPLQQASLADSLAYVRNRLSDSERTILDLRLAGLTWPEVAIQARKTEEAARKELRRAIQRVAPTRECRDALF